MRIKYLLLILPFFFACCAKPITPSKSPKNILRINLGTEPPSLDPRKATDTTSINIIEMCFEGLMRHGKAGHLEFGVAESFSVSEDQKTYVFTLRESKWSDGAPLTADDFVKTWLTTLTPSFASEFAHELYVFKNSRLLREGKCKKEDVGVQALDNRTIKIELEYPIPYFLELLSTPYFFPTPIHSILENPHWAKKFSSSFVNNGPFKMTKWKHYDEIALEKNPLYWDQTNIHIEAIHLPIIQDASTELNMFANNELDWMGAPFSTLPLDALPHLREKYTIHTYPIAGSYYYIFNTQTFPFNNLHLRKAFSLAIDRQMIIDNILQGKQLPAFWFVPQSLWKEPRSTPFFSDNSIEEAQKLFEKGIKELGYTKENLPPIILVYNTSEGHHKIAQAIQQQWKKAFGIDVQLQNKEWKVFLDELSKKQFQVARLGGLASYNDPVTFLDEEQIERSGWKNPQYTTLINLAMRTKDPIEREQSLKLAEEVLMNAMPYAPLYYYTLSYIKKDYLKGEVLTKTGHIDFKFASIERQEK